MRCMSTLPIEASAGGPGLSRRALRLIRASMRRKMRLAKLLRPKENCREPVLILDRGGNRYLLPNLIEPLAFSLWMNGLCEPQTYRFLLSNIGSGSIFVDVGANVGVFSHPIARRLAARMERYWQSRLHPAFSRSLNATSS